MEFDHIQGESDGETFQLEKVSADIANAESNKLKLYPRGNSFERRDELGNVLIHVAGTKAKVTSPGVGDDVTKGFVPTSLWIDEAASPRQSWICVNNAAGAAVWHRISSAAGSLPGSADMFDWDASPSKPPPEVESGDILTFEFQKGGPIRAVIGAIQYPVNRAPVVNPQLIVPFIVTTTGAGNGNVLWRLHVKYIAVGELSTKADDETLDIAAPVVNTLNRFHQTFFTLDRTKIAVNDYVSFSLERQHGLAGDTFTGRVGATEIAQFEAGL